MLFDGFPGGNVYGDWRIVYTITISWSSFLHISLFWVFFLHFLRILIDFYRTTALGCYILHFFSLGLILRTTATSDRVFLGFSHFWVISFLGQIDGVFYMISALQASCPIHWVRFYIYQVRSTSWDSDFCRVSTVMYSIVHFYPIAYKRMVLYAQGGVC